MPMSEPVDYLTEETYRPAWLKAGVTESTLDAVAVKKPELIELGKKIADAKRYFMVGSGGSYSVQLPLVYIAEKYTKVPVYAYSGWEFLERLPEAVDEDAVVILISQSGKTKEIVDALEWCNGKGTTTMGITQNAESVINEKTDIGYGWGARGVTFGKLMSMYYLFGSVFHEKGYSIGSKMMEETDKLPERARFFLDALDVVIENPVSITDENLCHSRDAVFDDYVTGFHVLFLDLFQHVPAVVVGSHYSNIIYVDI